MRYLKNFPNSENSIYESSIEIEHKIRTSPDEYIIKESTEYKNMSDKEFFKEYNNHKSKIITDKINESKWHISEKILKKLIKSKDLYLIKYMVINKDENLKNEYEYIIVSQNKREAKQDFKKLWEKGAKKIKSNTKLEILSITMQSEFSKNISKNSFKNKLMYN